MYMFIFSFAFPLRGKLVEGKMASTSVLFLRSTVALWLSNFWVWGSAQSYEDPKELLCELYPSILTVSRPKAEKFINYI